MIHHYHRTWYFIFVFPEPREIVQRSAKIIDIKFYKTLHDDFSRKGFGFCEEKPVTRQSSFWDWITKSWNGTHFRGNRKDHAEKLLVALSERYLVNQNKIQLARFFVVANDAFESFLQSSYVSSLPSYGCYHHVLYRLRHIDPRLVCLPPQLVHVEVRLLQHCHLNTEEGYYQVR